MKTTRYRFEKEVEGASPQTRAYLKGEFKNILESDKDFTRKADYIGFSIASIDDKIKGIDEEIKELQKLKKNINAAKEIAQEIGAEVFAEYGIEKIEGMGISSITMSETKVKQKEELIIRNEQKLIELGFTKQVLDIEKIKKTLCSADIRQKILAYADILVSKEVIPAKLKINKRRSANTLDVEKLEEVA